MSDAYVLDTNSFRVFGNYYPEIFPSFWEEIERLVTDDRLLSCREVAKELELQSPSVHLNAWLTVTRISSSTLQGRRWSMWPRSSRCHISAN